MTRLNAQGVADDVVVAVYENNGNLARTLKVVESDTGTIRVIWLEEGRLVTGTGTQTWVRDVGGSGWIHIRNNHIINPGGNEFKRYGSQFAESNPSYEENIRSLIAGAARDGIEFHDGGNIWRTYVVPDSGDRILKVLVGDNGYIVTIAHG